MSLFDAYYDLLPPHWSFDEDTQLYFNDITQEESQVHPIATYMRCRNQVLNLSSEDHISIEIEKLQHNQTDVHDNITNNESAPSHEVEDVSENSPGNPNWPDSPATNHNGTGALPPITPSEEQLGKNIVAEVDLPTGKFYEYHCQWTERDLFGKVNLYGLTLRYYEESHKTVIRFDGIVGDWVYSMIQGPYGPLEHKDFFVGAKITVFGRHLTISSASGTAIRWIERERKRLEKQQEMFREKIMAVGKVPCVKGKPTDIVRHITRGAPIEPGHADLRKISMINARLGEQLASLGLSDQL